MTRPRPQKAGLFREVEGLRALTALSVVLCHASFHYGPSGNRLLNFLTQKTSGQPVEAVVLFMVVSGFVIYLPFARSHVLETPSPRLLDYGTKRVARVVPAYWVALVIVSVWLGFSYMKDPLEIVRYFGFLQLYGSSHTLEGGIGPAWTLCVDMSFYAALPLLALLARRLSTRFSTVGSELILFGILVVAALLYQALEIALVPEPNGYQQDYLLSLPGMLTYFGLGMFLAVLSVEAPTRATPRRLVAILNRFPILCWAAAGAMLYAAEQVSPVHAERWWFATSLIKLLAGGLLVAPLVLGPQGRGPLRWFLGSAPMVWLGTITYGIYLWHFPILTKLAPRLVPHGMLYTWVVASALAIVPATLSYYLVEQPSRRLARRFLAIPQVQRRSAGLLAR